MRKNKKIFSTKKTWKGSYNYKSKIGIVSIKEFLIWQGPTILFILYLIFKLIWSTFKIYLNMGLASLGFLLIIVSIFLLLFWLSQNFIFLIIQTIIYLMGLIAIAIMVWFSEFSSFFVIFITTLYSVIIGIILIKNKKQEILYSSSNLRAEIYDKSSRKKHSLRYNNYSKEDNKENNNKNNNIHKIINSIKAINRNWLNNIKDKKKKNAQLILIILIIGTSGFGIYSLRANTPEPLTIVISNEEAKSYDLVVYFPNYKSINESVAQLFKDVNATLSFPLRQSNFQENNTDGQIAAEKVKILNNYRVKVEIWPLFENNEGSYPSLSEIDRWEDLYQDFQNWTIKNNITVDYLLWDIESGGEGINDTDIKNYPEPLQSLAKSGKYGKYMTDTKSIWEDAIEKVEEIGNQCKKNGHIMRTTTHTIVWDLFDGDPDIQQISRLPVWSASNSFEYISMMVYRGCEAGGKVADSSYVYENIRLSALTQKGTIAVCLGCLNYSPYPNITSVVEDIYLAYAAGARSIRLFQANSWIEGVGVWEGSSGMVYGGPAHGFDGPTGLRALLEAVREGGTVTYNPNSSTRKSIYYNVQNDVFLDVFY